MAAVNYKDLFDFSDPSEVEKAIQAIERLSKAYEEFLKETEKGSGKLSGKLADLTNQIQQNVDAIKDLNPANQKHQQNIDKISASVLKQSEQYKKLKEDQKSYAAQIKELKKAIDGLTKENEKLKKSTEESSKKVEAQAGSLADLSKQLREAKKEQDNLNKSLNPKAYADAEKRVFELTKQIEEQKKANRENARTFGVAEDSLEGMRVRLNQARRAYDQLSKVQRENDMVGGELLRTIQDLDQELKSLEKSTGRAQREVGNYKEQIIEALGEAEGFAGGLGNIGMMFQTAKAQAIQFFTVLTSNPWGAVVAAISAIILVIATLVSKFTESEKGSNLMSVAFAKLKDFIKPVTDLITIGARNIGKFFSTVISYLPEINKSGKGMVKTYAELEVIFQKLQRRQRNFEANNKAALADAERLKNIRDEESKSIDERIAANNELGEVEAKRLKEGFELRRDQVAAILEQIRTEKEAVLTAEERKKIDEEINRINESTAETYDISGKKLNEITEFLYNIESTQEQSQKLSEASLELNDLIEDSYGRQNEQIVNQFQLKKELLEFENEASIAVVEAKLAAVAEGTTEEKRLLLEKLQFETDAEIRQIEFSGRNEDQKQKLKTKILAEAAKKRMEIEINSDKEILKNAESVNKLYKEIYKNTNDQLTKNVDESLSKQINAENEALKKRMQIKQTEVNEHKRAEEAKTRATEQQAQLRTQAVQAASQIATEAINFGFELQKIKLEEEFNLLEQRKENELALAGDNAKARQRIEDKFDKEQQKLKIKQAKADKEQALFNIAISTAQGIVAALASVPPNIPLSIAIGITGALQAALVSSRPLPKFKKGRKGEGLAATLAVVNEEGQEIGLNRRTGEARLLGSKGNKGAELEFLQKGEEVLTAKESNDFLSTLAAYKIGTSTANRNGYETIQRQQRQSSQPERINYGKLAQAVGSQFSQFTFDQIVIEDGEMKRYIKKSTGSFETRNNRKTFKRGSE